NNAPGARRIDNNPSPGSASRAPINPRNARLNAAEAEDYEGEPGFGNLFEETNVEDASKGNPTNPENRSEVLEEVMQAGMPVPHGNPPPQPRIPDDKRRILSPLWRIRTLHPKMPEEKQSRQGIRGKRGSDLDEFEDALNRELQTDVFEDYTTHLRAMAPLAPDTRTVYLTSDSPQLFLLRVKATSEEEPTLALVDSGATDLFISKDWIEANNHPTIRLPIPIRLSLFDGEPTSSGEITHFALIRLTFENQITQELRMLVTKLHKSASMVLGLPWLQETNPLIDWEVLSMSFDRKPESKQVNFEIPSKTQTHVTSKATEPINLRSRAERAFVIQAKLESNKQQHYALIDSGAAGVFASDTMGLEGKPLERPLTLQLFDGNTATTGIISHEHSDTITLDNDLKFPVNFLLTRLHPSIPLVLGLPWLRKVNPEIDWKKMTMTFNGTSTIAASTILPLPRKSPPVLIEEIEDEDAPKPSKDASTFQPLLRDLREGE
ncbi:hypothetical protein H0H93_011966, partial [Arthromyces matolae]